ncbi:WbqC family protein [Cytophaga hutchinsonii]|jgi:hypothetical protein|uniref:WbqC-like protein n=1 Tax=Cytophaga hutchinsonii (strain ATCC 33406 / DSM 1761 / CIP 103989 / NBRC 15051 / NCIMB 9469 / D465) TaxID=269798 RepID=A0A6N4SPZ7_CYTH3|nr:WbqC family protein [Cytophaga hutchinsonii]ABG58354.1 conserved hypothetical protein [Cytophaga hutchinsonii ATCC 33406]SFX51901.1 WbqC-like protein family protein [Cytophaga hutchinsonii ATCC 33406]
MTNANDKSTSKKSTLLIDLHYLPAISYFKTLAAADTIILETQETFQKQTFRNRCEILTSNGKEALIVPILHGSSSMIKDIKIDYNQRWFQIHDRSIRSAYGKSPFFDFFIEGISVILSQKHTFLWDLNYALLTLCLENLTLKKVLLESNSYIKPAEVPDNLIDMRGKLVPQSKKTDSKFVIKPYQQVFGNEFVTDLSIVDLLFCAVLDSSEILKE